MYQAVGPRQAARVHEQRHERVEVAGNVRCLCQQEALHGALQARILEALLVHAQPGVHLHKKPPVKGKLKDIFCTALAVYAQRFHIVPRCLQVVGR